MHISYGLVVALCEVRERLTPISFQGATAVNLPDPSGNPTSVYDVTLPSNVNPPLPGSSVVIYFNNIVVNGTEPPFGVSFPNSSNFRVIRVNVGSYSLPTTTAGISGSIPQWFPKRTAVLYWQEGAGETSGWKVHAAGVDSQQGLPRGSFFQGQGMRLLQTGAKTEAWFAFSDYVINESLGGGKSNGGLFYLMRATRPNEQSPWTLGTLQRVLELPADAVEATANTPIRAMSKRLARRAFELSAPLAMSG